MNVAELIERLKKIPQDLPIRTAKCGGDDDENNWVVSIEHNDTGQSGYECCGEVRLVTIE